MNDDDYVNLSPADAFKYAMTKSPVERYRLSNLYSSKNGGNTKTEPRYASSTVPEINESVPEIFYGVILLIGGLILSSWGAIFDPTVSSSYGGAVVNIGQMGVKQMIFNAGGFVSLAGVVLLQGGFIRRAIIRNKY